MKEKISLSLSFHIFRGIFSPRMFYHYCSWMHAIHEDKTNRDTVSTARWSFFAS